MSGHFFSLSSETRINANNFYRITIILREYKNIKDLRVDIHILYRISRRKNRD